MRNQILLMILTIIGMNTQGQNKNYNKLNEEEKHVIINKGTERPFTGKYETHEEDGTYSCKQCGVDLYKSDTKFDASCGWPSFDEEIKGAVTRTTDADGRRTEITCSNCGGHLGHVFEGENYTSKNTRHCVNSISLDFKPVDFEVQTLQKQETAYFASGCFWGTQFHFQKQDGVISTEVGYMGGHIKKPSYEQVCTGKTGHAEAVKVVFDPEKISYRQLAILFFETHDPSQVDGQGPDIGSQYRSAVFYTRPKQKETIEELSEILESKGIDVVTEIEKAGVYYSGEKYHQNYYQNKGGSPYCHIYQKKF
ncbi:MAG: bifunctional methionine sulfoxide reductase B/A protein [Bacteroidales bacterium]|nr:bifunctional methionine sulfoxide reductase B/A protein [Bacteroidales bacterium]